jgi:hypothetical protein
VIATAIAAEEGMSLQDAIETVQQFRERARPHTKLRINAYAYLSTEEGRQRVEKYVRKITDEVQLREREAERVEIITQNA